MNRRGSGVLAHITSLPSRFGIGDLGPEAFRFADFLAAAGQSYWQILPLNPTDPEYDNSPYHSLSAFAFSTLLISPEALVAGGLCREEDLPDLAGGSEDVSDYVRSAAAKVKVFRVAYETFRSRPSDGRFERFCAENAHWLDDFARFRAIKTHFGGRAWSEWPVEIMERRPGALRDLEGRLRREIDEVKFLQYVFFEQWSALRGYCRERGIDIIGDMPIYVDYDSADVWTNPEIFKLDEKKRPLAVAGVPPDYFSETGQLWGNPLYRWDALARTGYAWWIDRFRAVLALVDLVRLDHFRGFEAYWEVPGDAETAIAGRWVKGPGAALFEALRDALGELPIVAENLGVITPEVEALREGFGFPGMAVLQFAFGSDAQANDFLPHNYPRNKVVYTGTHDNDTVVGWWTAGVGNSTRTAADVEKEHDRALAYCGGDGREIHWDFVRTLFVSVADTAIVPLQDVLGEGTSARMNLPGRPQGNWRWRFAASALTPQIRTRLRALTEGSGRCLPA
jgi:4-alpha-glucanotransferase